MIHANPVEVLEARIAPAFVLTPEISADGKSATFVDIDGDVFTVTTTKGTFTQNNFVYVGEAETGPGYLQKIDLGFSTFGRLFQGAKITVAVDQFVGDGFADVGFINAAGIDLKEAVVDGDLVAIDVGNSDLRSPAIKLLQTSQLGFHTATDAGLPDFVSHVIGKVNVLSIGDWADASIQINGNIGRASILSLTGSDLSQSGTLKTIGSIGTLVVQGDLKGGSADGTGAISAEHKIGSLTIGGSVRGGAGMLSGSISSNAKIVSLTIGGNIQAGSASHSGSVVADSARTISIGGILIGGPAVGGILVDKVLTKLTLGGTDGTSGPPTIVAGGPAAGGIAIKKISATGSVSGARILAGYDSNLTLINPNARIGKITVGEDLIATDIVAGIDGVNGVFGDSDDRVATNDPKPAYQSSISSIIVSGIVAGTNGGTDQFGVLAERIGFVQIGGIPLPLGKKTIDDLPLGTFGDYRLREIIASV
jgi:hypothetical protein